MGVEFAFGLVDTKKRAFLRGAFFVLEISYGDLGSR
jgi:hypothetical protein